MIFPGFLVIFGMDGTLTRTNQLIFGSFNHDVHTGVPRVLHLLKSRGVKLAVFTGKGQMSEPWDNR